MSLSFPGALKTCS